MKKRMAKLGKNMFAPDLSQEFKKKSEKAEGKADIKVEQDASLKQEPKTKDTKANNLANLFSNDEEDTLFPSEKVSTKIEPQKNITTPTPKTDSIFSLAPTTTTTKKSDPLSLFGGESDSLFGDVPPPKKNCLPKSQRRTQ